MIVVTKHSTATRPGRARRRCGPSGRDAGFGSLELVILTPVLLLMLLLVVGFGRLTHGRDLVQQAASAAARAATLNSNPTQAGSDATEAAHEVLDHAGVSCNPFTVTPDTSEFGPGGQVSVTVTCTTSLSDLGLVGFPGHKTLTASATSPLEEFRQYDIGGDSAP